jgi:tetrahedral aminopeptidase
MKDDRMFELIQKLTEAWGPSGYEHQVRALIQQEVMGLADAVRVDPLGNLICRVGTTGGKKIMVAAHMDEIGLITTFIEPKSGYLRFTNLGGLLQTTLAGNRVRFEDGTIGTLGVHDQWGAGRTTVSDINQLYIDVSTGDGAPTVGVGSPAVLWRECVRRGQRVIAKSMDDRIACAVLIETMRNLKKQSPNDIYFTFTVQEEVGLRGARAAAGGILPHLAIAVDVCPTGDEIKNTKMAVQLGGGAAIKIHDTGLIVPPAVRDWMIQRAEADGIRYQRELLTLGSTDAAAIQTAGVGVPSGAISIPCRYVHTTSETVDLGDVQACVALLTGLLANPADVTV